MSEQLNALAESLSQHFGERLLSSEIAFGEITIEVSADDLQSACQDLKEQFAFEQLIDLAGVDYLHYGVSEWDTEQASSSGFSRGVEAATSGRFTFDDAPSDSTYDGARFGVTYHLLSVSNNQRLRLKVACADDDFPVVDSVVDIWRCADWFEREAFDMYGIVFGGHPDLRRILTDYGFVGHPFRKDFPLVGHVEMRFDPEQGRVVYEPVSIEPRVLVPKVIREDHRYIDEVTE